MSLHALSSKVANYITMEAELKPGQTDSVRYGIEILLGTLIKGITLLTTAVLLNILPQVAIALFCGSLLRLVSGGVHCTSYLRCLICALAIYLSTGKAACILERVVNQNELRVILLPCFLIMVLCACIWAPAEVPYRTMNSHEAIIFKGLTLAFLTVCLTIFYYYANEIKFSYIMAGLLALLVQTLSITPAGYLVIGKMDATLFHITTKKGGA